MFNYWHENDTNEYHNSLISTYSDMYNIGLEPVIPGCVKIVIEEMKRQEELLDRTYSEIIHEFDKVVYMWFVITFNDKLKRVN